MSLELWLPPSTLQATPSGKYTGCAKVHRSTQPHPVHRLGGCRFNFHCDGEYAPWCPQVWLRGPLYFGSIYACLSSSCPFFRPACRQELTMTTRSVNNWAPRGVAAFGRAVTLIKLPFVSAVLAGLLEPFRVWHEVHHQRRPECLLTRRLARPCNWRGLLVAVSLRWF
jgi:uncharacterized protein YceK